MNFIPLDLIKSLAINDGWIRSHYNDTLKVGDIVYRYSSLPMTITSISKRTVTCGFIYGGKYKTCCCSKDLVKKFKDYKKLMYEDGMPIIS